MDDAVSEGEMLDANDATLFRAVTARLNYLAHDRPDIRYATMAVSASMASPSAKDMERLKRIGRYLKGRPKATNFFQWQPKDITVMAYSDADWAGDKATRRSVSGGCLMMGKHCVKSWAKKQQVVALSSAESELYAGLRAATEGLGIQAIGKDLGRQVDVELYMDSSAALSLLSRKGLGKAKHIELQHLWLQDAVKQGRISVHKIHTVENPADLMTKALSRERTEHLMNLMGYRFS